MSQNKSDFKRFCETMWIMVKYDVLPILFAAGLCAAVTLGVKDAKSKETTDIKTTFFQRQR